MDNSNLNLAHYYGRRAENHLKHFRYDKAIENYQKAAEFTEEAMKGITSQTVLASLRLQHKDHMRQVNLIQLKKAMVDKYIKELERQRENESNPKKRSPNGSRSSASTDRSNESSPKQSSQGSSTDAICRTILEMDLQENSIPQLAPLELPPLLDFESFSFNRLDKDDL
ncbi:unnamed protein product [Hermetia illucens]|uniref:Nuclear receptor-binding factor 2 MIT domain-containing protein n=1 Tax=Hermetia illucens TaxID=343691 RepID=A0A7R8YQQ8_HERIL|nr:nuclear receptor-binding factor 2 [Hermetia illucens]CAD7082116.1 unnamed protein product [Hermetia illucens]